MTSRMSTIEAADTLTTFKAALLRAEMAKAVEKRTNTERWRIDMANDPTTVCKEIVFLLSGNHGHVAKSRIEETYALPLDWLLETVAALAYGVPRTMHVRAYKSLDSMAKMTLRDLIHTTVKAYEF